MSKRPRLSFDHVAASSSEETGESVGANESEIMQREVNATQLADMYLATNPATSLVDSNPDDVSKEPNSIEYVRKKVLKGCSSSRKCFQRLPADDQEIHIHHLNVTEMSKTECDMLIMANIEAGVHKAESSTRNRISYRYHNVEVCIDTFLFIHAITLKYLKAIRSWYLQNGLVPRVHGNTGRRPPHAFDHSVIKAIVQFIKIHTEVHGIPQPAAPRGRADIPPTYLPASQNFKTVHSQYVAACTTSGNTHVGYSVFKSVWHQCMPHVRLMTPRTDVPLPRTFLLMLTFIKYSSRNKLLFTSNILAIFISGNC